MIRQLLWRFKDSRYNNPLFYALGGFILITIIILIAFVINLITTSNQTEVYNDPLSGETVYTPKDRTAEKYQADNQITYLGFAELLDRGFTFSEVQSLKSVIENIPDSTDKVESIREVSIDIDSVNHTSDDLDHQYTFGMRINRKTDFTGVVTIQKSNGFITFAMKDKEGEVVYDSGESH